MLTLAEIMQLCRLCSASDRVHIPIFEGDAVNSQTFQKISECLPIKVSKEDDLPKNICDHCYSKLELQYSFWKMTTNTEQRLITWLNQAPVKATASHQQVHFSQEDSNLCTISRERNEESLLRSEADINIKFKSENCDPRIDSNVIPKREDNCMLVADDINREVDFNSRIHDSTGGAIDLAMETERDKDFTEEPEQVDFVSDPFKKSLPHLLQQKYSIKLENKKGYQCTACGYQSMWFSTLKRHIWIHTGEYPYKCMFCSYATRCRSNVQNHIRHKHTKEKPAACDLCDYKCVTLKDLKRHKMKHTLEKPFVCSICQRGFIQSSDLQRHLLTHSNNEKPLKCDQCDFSTIQSCGLKVHKNYKHSGNKPYECNVCNHKFTQVRDLKQHVFTHSEDKPFKCSDCTYQCIRVSSFINHLEKIHEQPDQMKIF